MVAPGYGLAVTTQLLIGATASNWTITSKQVTGTITGLTGSGLVLQNNGIDTITIPANSTSFAFPGNARNGTSYNVAIVTMPTSPVQTCAISNGSSAVPSNSDPAISIVCYEPGAFTLAKVSGDQQTVTQHNALAQPLVVNVLDRIGKPVPATQVTFRPVPGTGYLPARVVTTDAAGNASLPAPYVHAVGQQIEAAVPGASSAIFSFNVVPNAHAYDGLYACAIPNYPFTLKLVNGVLDPAASIIVRYFRLPWPINGSINEANGVLSATSPFERGMATVSGQFTVDAEQRASAAGTSTNDADVTDPFRGNWTCQRQ